MAGRWRAPLASHPLLSGSAGVCGSFPPGVGAQPTNWKGAISSSGSRSLSFPIRMTADAHGHVLPARAGQAGARRLRPRSGTVLLELVAEVVVVFGPEGDLDAVVAGRMGT